MRLLRRIMDRLWYWRKWRSDSYPRSKLTLRQLLVLLNIGSTIDFDIYRSAWREFKNGR